MLELVKCSVCLIDKPDSDYVNKNGRCYKCVYAAKIKKLSRKKINVTILKTCKICQEMLPRSRWTYCSLDCAKVAKSREKHWTLRFKGDTKNWKQRFIIGKTANFNPYRGGS